VAQIANLFGFALYPKARQALAYHKLKYKINSGEMGINYVAGHIAFQIQ